MPAYAYEAMDAQGRTKKGVIAADSMRDARKRLQAGSLFPVHITESRQNSPASAPQKYLSAFTKHRGIKARDLTLLTRQMATMIGAGTPVEEALAALVAQADKKVNRAVLTRLKSAVTEGTRLSEAMAQEKETFSSLYRSMVAAGEASGDLGGILDRIADYSEKSEVIKTKVQTAMVYPLVLSTVATLVVLILMTFVVPKVVSQFDAYGADLPTITRVVMAVSAFLTQYGLYLLFGLTAGALLMGAALKQPAIRLKLDRTILRLPVIGKLVQSVSSARFARTVGTLVDGGSPVLEALYAARETVSNHYIRQAVDKVCEDVRDGASLSRSIRQVAAFAPLMIYMAAIGEKSGTLAMMLTRVADYLESEFDSFTQTALSLLEPMIVIVMGLVVGTIVLSIMLPIMQLNSLVLT